MFEVGDWGEEEAPPPPRTVADADLEALLQRVELSPAEAVAAAPARAKPPPARVHAAPAAPQPPAAPAGPSVELGFADAGQAHPRFPSKVGGAPVWLHPQPPGALSCARCGRGLRLLLQLYCPRPGMPHAFHCSVLLFCCGGDCLETPAGWRALRCVLPEAAPLEPPRAGGSACSDSPDSPACGPTAAGATDAAGAAASRAPLPELPLSIDVEGDWEGWLEEWDWSEVAAAEAAAERYRARHAADAGAAPDDALSEAELGEGEGEDEGEDDALAAFQRRVSAWPEQVLRYCHHADAQPLWLSRLRRPAEVPPCGRCGAPRWFEYQIVPNLVASIERAAEAVGAGDAAAPEEALDWGTVAVFTCSASCAATGEADAYAEEYCWHQTA